MTSITPTQMYIALCKAAAAFKEDAQTKCPHYRPYISTSKGDELNMCTCSKVETKCSWPYGCPLLKEAEND